MKYFLPLIALSALFISSCSPLEVEGPSGSSSTLTRLAIYNFDVNVAHVEGQDNFAEFTDSDSTIILQITRTDDPDIGVSGDEFYQTVYIVVPDSLTELQLSGDEWDNVKSFAFTNREQVLAPVGRVTGGSLSGLRLLIDNSWELQGEIEVSESFGTSFPTDMTGIYSSR